MSNHPKSIPKSSARLFQSIINQCWDDVILQVTDYPEITKRWVVFPQEENIGHSCPHASSVPGRRLPLHEALIHKAPHNVRFDRQINDLQHQPLRLQYSLDLRFGAGRDVADYPAGLLANHSLRTVDQR